MKQILYKPGRIFLSVPHMGGHERNYVQKAPEELLVDLERGLSQL